MKIIDEHTFEGKGYHPFLITDRWQVAYLNYAEAESLEQIEKLDIHHQTDEVFILLQGKAALIGASVTDQNITYDVVNMQPGIVYNIRREVWHKIAMQPGSQVLIIENNDTDYLYEKRKAGMGSSCKLPHSHSLSIPSSFVLLPEVFRYFQSLYICP